MSSQQALEVIVKFNGLPNTKEKKVIEMQYLKNEIGNFEFFQLADRYINKLTNKDSK